VPEYQHVQYFYEVKATKHVNNSKVTPNVLTVAIGASILGSVSETPIIKR
jgi:hypothetical protein